MTTWTQLQADVISWTNRTDISDKIASFVGVFEARCRRNLRVRAMETPFSGTIDSSNQIALPAGFLAFKTLWPTATQQVPLTVQFLDYVMARDSQSGVPTSYALDGANIFFDGSGDVSGVYYTDVPGLVANSSNWLSLAAYDAYLYGTLAEAWDYLQEDAQAQKYLQRSAVVLESLIGADARDKHSGPLVARKR
jgi:hypothetical protein